VSEKSFSRVPNQSASQLLGTPIRNTNSRSRVGPRKLHINRVSEILAQRFHGPLLETQPFSKHTYLAPLTGLTWREI
jgi:hypothetical protein